MNPPTERPDSDAYTELHFSVFAALSQLAPAYLLLVQSRTKELLGRSIRMDEIKEVMTNSPEDLKRALCGIGQGNRLANCSTATNSFTMGAPGPHGFEFDRFPFVPLGVDFMRPNSGDPFIFRLKKDAEQSGAEKTKEPIAHSEKYEVKEAKSATEKEKETVVPEKPVDISVCNAEKDVTEFLMSKENVEDGGLNPKSSDEMTDEWKMREKEGDEEQKNEEEDEETEVDEEEKDATFVDEMAGGDRHLANETFSLSIETPILHQVFEQSNDVAVHRNQEGFDVSETSHDMEEEAAVEAYSEAATSPTLVPDVGSNISTPAKERLALDFADVGDEPEPWNPTMGQQYNVVITYAKDPSDFYVMKRVRFDEDCVSTKLSLWWNEVKNESEIYVKPVNVVPGLPVGVIRSQTTIERGVVVSLASNKPCAEIRLVDRGFHETVAFSRLCYLSKARLIDGYPAIAVHCSVDARTTKFTENGTPIWPPKVMGSLRKAVDTAAPYNAVFYSYDGVKYVANLYIQKYACEENKSLLFHVLKHLKQWNQPDQQSPTLSSAGSFAISAIVQETQDVTPKKEEEQPSVANPSDSTDSSLDIEEVDLHIEDIDDDFPLRVPAAAAPVVPTRPLKPFPSCGFPPIRR